MENIKNLTVEFRGIEIIPNSNGGYIQITLANHAEKRMIKENFFLGKTAIKNTLINLGFWIRNLVKNDEEFQLPDPEYLAMVEGKDPQEAYQEVVNQAIEELKTLIGKEIEVHQEKTTATNRLGVTGTYYNIRPWKYEPNSVEADTAGTDFKGFI